MIKTVYRICRDSGKTYPTKAPYSYTSEEFIDDYMNSTFVDYNEIYEFDNIDDALFAFNNTRCAPAQLRKTSYGYYFYLYEVLVLQSVFYDDEEDIEDITWLSKKASSITTKGVYKMKFEQINTATENAIAAIRNDVARGYLKYESDCFAFLAGYTENEAIIFSRVWEAINQLVKDGRIERAW